MAFQQYPQKGGIPSGNTAGRPSGPVIGDTYYNGELGLLEIYDGTNWVPSSAPAGIPTVTATDVGTGRAYASGAINFSFVAGINGGAPYGFNGVAVLGGTSYTTGNTTSTTATLSVGIPGTYSVSGSAYNGFGASPGSVPGSLAVTTVPDAPTSVTGSNPTTNSIVVSWTAPNTGGKTITQYTVTPFIGSTAQTTITTSSTSVTASSLTAGTYTFKVKATNANGTGLDSTASAAVTTLIPIDFLVVAGGGGGAGHNAGGGGGGGLRSSVGATGGLGTLESAVGIALGTSYTITVGAGGSRGNSGVGTNGSNSVFATITSTGGGYGGSAGNGPAAGNGGGSGGGSGQGTLSGGARTASPVQGFDGGASTTGSANGGAGGGGAGVQVNIDTANLYYAGGGGGSGYSGSGGNGGIGGGGGGGNAAQGGSAGTGGGSAINSGDNGTQGFPSDRGGNAGANTGGGGGGGNRETNGGGVGGSGVVTLRWLTAAGTITVGAGLTAGSTGTDGSYSYKRFTAGTGTVSWS